MCTLRSSALGYRWVRVTTSCRGKIHFLIIPILIKISIKTTKIIVIISTKHKIEFHLQKNPYLEISNSHLHLPYHRPPTTSSLFKIPTNTAVKTTQLMAIHNKIQIVRKLIMHQFVEAARIKNNYPFITAIVCVLDRNLLQENLTIMSKNWARKWTLLFSPAQITIQPIRLSSYYLLWKWNIQAIKVQARMDFTKNV